MAEARSQVVTFNEDVVRFYDDDAKRERYGVVVRCWRDEPLPDDPKLLPGQKPLEMNELELSCAGEASKTVDERKVEIIDRFFVLGDIVTETCSHSGAVCDKAHTRGIVVESVPRYRLAPYFDPSEQPLEGWFEADQLEAYCPLSRGDQVIYENWLGIVEDIIEAAAFVEDEATGQIARTCGPFGSFWLNSDADIDLNGLRKAKVLDIQQTTVSVNWLCMNQLELDSTPPAKLNRPKRYWNDLDRLYAWRSFTQSHHTIGDAVIFRHENMYTQFPPLPVSDVVSKLPSAKALVVISSETQVTVSWQDGTTSTLSSKDLQHSPAIDDDLDAYPGEMVAHVPAGSAATDETRRAGIVQSMNSAARTVKLRWYGTDEIEVVPALEVDSNGPPDTFVGVRVLDPVLIAPKAGTGEKPPLVARLGESEVHAGLWPTQDENRAAIAMLGVEHALRLGFSAASRAKVPSESSHLDWCGTVVQTRLDGTAVVEFPDGSRGSFGVERLYQLDDGRHAQPDPVFDDEFAEDDEDAWMSEDDIVDGEGGYGDDAMIDIVDEQGEPITSLPAHRALHFDADADADADASDAGTDDGTDKKSANAIEPNGHDATGVSMPADIDDDERWQRFAILEEVPADHHFASQTFSAPSKGFTARVRKEYSILSSSLPSNILVRVYEERADLMRVLIIGPVGTPFANAPFLFDLYLSPDTFPREPPQVYFHSWAGGTRVSPNLYAEGKVCLSLLGTWQSGDKSEAWNTGSTLLQVFVSIQALIMVEEPYYTEPGLEKEQGTARGRTASMHYSERTYALTRGFVKRACEFPPAGFEAEIKAYYLEGLATDNEHGALAAIVDEGQQLVAESEEWNASETSKRSTATALDAGRPQSKIIPSLKVLTEGACLTLKRTLASLAKVQESATA